MKIKYPEATHIACAYHLKDPNGPFNQGSFDDKDWGVGCTLLNMLKDEDATKLVIFVAQIYGGIHLGSRHFEIYEQTGECALKQLR